MSDIIATTTRIRRATDLILDAVIRGANGTDWNPVAQISVTAGQWATRVDVSGDTLGSAGMHPDDADRLIRYLPASPLGWVTREYASDTYRYVIREGAVDGVDVWIRTVVGVVAPAGAQS